jgi:hypothetical protein
MAFISGTNGRNKLFDSTFNSSISTLDGNDKPSGSNRDDVPFGDAAADRTMGSSCFGRIDSNSQIDTECDLPSTPSSSTSLMTLYRPKPLPGASMLERPSDDMIDERIDAWHRDVFGLEATVYDALGWSRDEYMVWLANPGAAPSRPLPPLPKARSSRERAEPRDVVKLLSRN